MGLQLFKITDENPNRSFGHGGCLCDETLVPDCKPPYAVFYNAEMYNPQAPHAVLCQHCAEYVVRQMKEGAKPEVLEGTAEDADED